MDLLTVTRCETARAHLFAGQTAEAERIYRSVLAEQPSCTPALQGLGEVALLAKAYDSAARYFTLVLSADPRLVAARVSLGLALKAMGRQAEAFAAFKQAAIDDPRYGPAHYWLGWGLLEAGDLKGAVASLNTAVKVQPDLIGALSRSLYDFLETCEWRSWAKVMSFIDATLPGPRVLFDPMILMMTGHSQSQIARCSRLLAAAYHPPLEPLCVAPHPRTGRIKIAYLTQDYHDHPVAHLNAAILESHDRTAYEVTAVSYGHPDSSDVRRRVEAAVDVFLEVEQEGDEAVARMLFERKIDIAISLSGYTGNCRPNILARRPAPVQVNYQGYPGTMGASYIDYLIADRHVIPPPDIGLYDEQIVWMPHSYQPTDDKAPIDDRPQSRRNEGLPDGAFVLMVYNRAHKISPGILEVWMQILKRVPDSVLWLQDGGATAQTNLRREAHARGVAPERLIFARRTATRPEHIARHKLADLFVDTLPYNAHATASDAMWAGLPVVTCRGATFPGRVCASLLTAAGFPELVCENLEAYEDLVVSLARDPARLRDLRRRVGDRAPKSPLFQTADYTRHLETAYKTMYERNQAGLPPASFAVAAG